MMPSVHILTATVVALRMRPRTSVFWLPFLVLIAHGVLDFIPHLEPSTIGLDHRKLFSPGFFWTLADIGVATVLTGKIAIRFPEYRKLIALCYIAALGPDVFQAVVAHMPFLNYGWVRFVVEQHDGLHTWWRAALPELAEAIVSTFLTFLLWLGGVGKLWPATKGAEVNVPVKTSAAAAD